MRALFAAYPVLWIVAIGYLAAMNLTAFLLMRKDKLLAKRPCARRIPERVLFLTAILGGSLGAAVGMQVFAHKTKHWYFALGLPAILMTHVTLVLLLMRCM